MTNLAGQFDQAREQIEQARRMDLLTYLQMYEPGELVCVHGETYSTRTNDSIKISNGKWFRFSRGYGGRSALDYLIKVREMSFNDAVSRILNKEFVPPPVTPTPEKQEKEKAEFCLPKANADNLRVVAYLRSRGIADGLIQRCISLGKLYESDKRHNCVFVGTDEHGAPRHATMRGTSDAYYAFKGDAANSDKRFAFSLTARELTAQECRVKEVHVFESPIDLLSFLTLAVRDDIDKDIRDSDYISLCGVYIPKKEAAHSAPPQALAQYLKNNPHTKTIYPCLDNDEAGYGATQIIRAVYGDRYDIDMSYYPKAHDYNDQLRETLDKEAPQRVRKEEPER
jgi:hypothetical protein